MGTIKKLLVNRELPGREPHNSRLFVDLSEQVHIHFRELRTQFSVEEFFEYADIIARSAQDLRKWLDWHPEYREQKTFDNIVVAIGPDQQTRPLHKSPRPHESAYFDRRLQIELQGEKVIDEIHLHYRDHRLVMDREAFRALAEAMGEAMRTLDRFLAENEYVRETHPFRKAVVEDRLYESRSWEKIESNRISFLDRIKAVLRRAIGAGRRRGT